METNSTNSTGGFPSLVDNTEPEEHSFQYDLIIIGGGSGGLACAQEAAKWGKKTAIFDFVQKSPFGTSWGLGGTCVNVGCIPKKLMHQASLLGEAIHDAEKYGWTIVPSDKQHTWEKLVGAVKDHISSQNWSYRSSLREQKVEYINSYAEFVDAHTIEGTSKSGVKTLYTARRFVVACGMRPYYPEIPGIEHCISSDDLFYLAKPPGKTLVVGASYVALECGGFLAGLGYQVGIMVRSILLRGFDQGVAELIGSYMENHGVKFIRPATPEKIEKLPDGKLRVEYKHHKTGEILSDVYDTVLMAVGRKPETNKLKLDKAGVKLNASGKITTFHEQSNIPHIYALGDITEPGLELTPSAIKAGLLLARRLYGKSKILMDYTNVPTTVFTPLEYGCCGMSEEAAIEKYGKENIEVFHIYYKPLEWTVAEREDQACYCKLITNKLDHLRVIGFHVLGPNAGEQTQGFAVAMKAGATKEHFDSTVGIHPTCAEEFTTLTISKSSGVKPLKSGGC